MFEIDIGFAGTLLGALIGALALLVTVRKTAEKVHDNFRADKLAEAKRDVYLELVDAWMIFILDINSFRIMPEKDFHIVFFQSNKRLVSSLHKSSFISEPVTKKEIMDFTFELSLKTKSISVAIRSWYENDGQDRVPEEQLLINLMEDLGFKALNLQNKLREELGIINDQKIDEYIFNRQVVFSRQIKTQLFNSR
ncbi:hypothetical protein [Acinetobacter sp.]|uniref:hypothetical protein n=1 Tax=Acinetobacter sp. TaxID=472 RepID=UPI002FC7F35F